MGYYGFDSLSYPGDTKMQELRTKTPIKFCGYYLPGAPNRSTSQWNGKRTFLAGINFGMLPIYVGQQQDTVSQGGSAFSHTLTDAQARIDADQALSLMGPASSTNPNGQGFPAQTYVYLDIETPVQSAPTAALYSYAAVWCARVNNSNRYRAGVYISYRLAPNLRTQLQALGTTAQFWVTGTANGPGCTVPNPNSAPDPTTNYAYASVWQYAIDCPNVTNLGATLTGVDMDSASTADPAQSL